MPSAAAATTSNARSGAPKPASPPPIVQTTPYPHEAIVDRIEAGDTDGAEKLLQLHIRRGKQLLIERVLDLDLGIPQQGAIESLVAEKASRH